MQHYSPPSCQSSNNVALDPNKSACTSIFDSRAREECSRDTWLPGSCGTIIDSWPDRWGSASRNPSWPSSTSSFSIGTNRVRDKVEWYTDKRFSRFLVRGPRYSYPISLLIYFLHCFSHSLLPFLNPSFPLRLPRTTRTRCRADFSQPTRFRDTYATSTIKL